MTNNDLYEVHDLYCASYALARGLDLKECFIRPEGWCIFVFEREPLLQVLEEWRGMHAQVDVHRFVASEKYLRTLMRR